MFLTKDNKLKWKWIGIAFAIVIALCAAGIFWFDKPLFLLLRRFNCGVWDIFQHIFEAKVWLIVTFVISTGIFAINTVKSKDKIAQQTNKFSLIRIYNNFIERSKTNSAFVIFCSVLSASAVAGVLKILIGRARPIFFELWGTTGFYPGTAEWAFNSMPSGHTTASFAGLVMIGMLYPKLKPFTWTLAIIIGVSRICYGMHWPTDILLGAFIGMIAADLVKWFFYRK